MITFASSSGCRNTSPFPSDRPNRFGTPTRRRSRHPRPVRLRYCCHCCYRRQRLLSPGPGLCGGHALNCSLALPRPSLRAGPHTLRKVAEEVSRSNLSTRLARRIARRRCLPSFCRRPIFLHTIIANKKRVLTSAHLLRRAWRCGTSSMRSSRGPAPPKSGTSRTGAGGNRTGVRERQRNNLGSVDLWKGTGTGHLSLTLDRLCPRVIQNTGTFSRVTPQRKNEKTLERIQGYIQGQPIPQKGTGTC